MYDGRHHRAGPWKLVPGCKHYAVLVQSLRRIRDRIVDMNAYPERGELPDDVDDAGVAQVGTVLLECESQHVHRRPVHRRSGLDHQLDRLISHVLAHTVIDAAPRQDDLRVVAEHIGLMRQIVGIDADAVSPYQSRAEVQEIPFRARGFQYLGRVDSDLVEDQCELVDQRDVEVPLGVFDHLGGLGDLDAARPVHARRDDAPIELGDLVEGLGRVAGDDFGDPCERMLLVARIDALRRVADEKVPPPCKSGVAFDHGHADFFGRPGIDGRLEHDDCAALQVLAHRFARRKQRAEVRLVRLIHRCRHCDDDEIRLGEVDRLSRDAKSRCSLELRRAYLAGRVQEVAIRRDLALGKIEADGRMSLSKLDGQGQTYVSQANHRNDGHVDSLPGIRACARRPAVPRPGCLRPGASVGLERLLQCSHFGGAIGTAGQPRRLAGRLRRGLLIGNFVVVRSRLVRRRFARLCQRIQLLARSLLLAGFDKRFGQMQPEVRVVRRTLHCLPELLESLSEITFLDQERSHRVHYSGVRRRERQRLLGIRQRLGIAQFARHPGEVIEIHRIVGL